MVPVAVGDAAAAAAAVVARNFDHRSLHDAGKADVAADSGAVARAAVAADGKEAAVVASFVDEVNAR